MKKARLLLISLSLYLSLSFLFATPSYAATTSTCSVTSPFSCLGEAVNTAILGATNKLAENMARNTADLFISLFYTFDTFLGGTPECQSSSDCPNNVPCQNNICIVSAGESPLSSEVNPFLRGGFIGGLAYVTGSIYDFPPNRMINAQRFVENTLANNILNPTPAYASGIDTLKSTGMLKLWQLMRNISYLGLAAVLAIFGLMVMLRSKIDPRTTVTFQMALPRVAIALVLIYFSFSISGLLLDVGEVTTQIIKGFFEGVGAPLTKPSLPLIAATWPVSPSFGDLLRNFFVSQALRFDLWDFPALGGLVNGALGLVVKLFVLFVLLHIVFTLIFRYVQLLLQTTFAPISFLMAVLPSQENNGISRWFKQILVNVLTFPGIYLIVNIANFIRLYNYNTPTPLPGAFGPNFSSNISGLLAIGVLALAPKVPAVLEQILDVVPGAHVSRAGVEPGAVLKGVPIVGKLAG